MCSNCLKDETFKILVEFINGLPSKEVALIEVIHKDIEIKYSAVLSYVANKLP